MSLCNYVAYRKDFQDIFAEKLTIFSFLLRLKSRSLLRMWLELLQLISNDPMSCYFKFRWFWHVFLFLCRSRFALSEVNQRVISSESELRAQRSSCVWSLATSPPRPHLTTLHCLLASFWVQPRKYIAAAAVAADAEKVKRAKTQHSMRRPLAARLTGDATRNNWKWKKCWELAALALLKVESARANGTQFRLRNN